MAEPVDYYELLQVSPNADQEIIQAAFKRLALRWHPDRRPSDPEAAQQMTLLNKAYEVLANPEKRKAYDSRRSQAAARTAAPEAPPPPAERAEGRRKAKGHSLGKKLRPYFRDTSHVHALAWIFIGLSLADLFITYLLLQTGPHFYESNPVAHWFFRRWNILGMTLFKFAVVGVVVALGEIIERNRPALGRLILVCGCAATLFAIARGLHFHLGGAD